MVRRLLAICLLLVLVPAQGLCMALSDMTEKQLLNKLAENYKLQEMELQYYKSLSVQRWMSYNELTEQEKQRSIILEGLSKKNNELSPKVQSEIANANVLLKNYADEKNSEIKKLKAKCTLWKVLAAVAGAVAIAKSSKY